MRWIAILRDFQGEAASCRVTGTYTRVVFTEALGMRHFQPNRFIKSGVPHSVIRRGICRPGTVFAFLAAD
jgi:hypothetical protein